MMQVDNPFTSTHRETVDRFLDHKPGGVGKTLVSDGETLTSYASPIARFNDEGCVVLIQPPVISQTTRRHFHLLRDGAVCAGVPIIQLDELYAYDGDQISREEIHS